MDVKTLLKPIELIDIGVDKLTKLPVPILNSNMIISNDYVEDYLVDDPNNNLIKIPVNTFIISINSTGITMDISVTDTISLTINYESEYVITGSTGTTYTASYYTNSGYTTPSLGVRDVVVTGELYKVSGLTCVNSGVFDVDISKMTKLKSLNLSGNNLQDINIDGLINLNYINLSGNSLANDSIDDIFITVDTFFTFSGTIDVTGINNGIPSSYSEKPRRDLEYKKNWILLYNTVDSINNYFNSYVDDYIDNYFM